jgi:hypothetical protein
LDPSSRRATLAFMARASGVRRLGSAVVVCAAVLSSAIALRASALDEPAGPSSCFTDFGSAIALEFAPSSAVPGKIAVVALAEASRIWEPAHVKIQPAPGREVKSHLHDVTHVVGSSAGSPRARYGAGLAAIQFDGDGAPLPRILIYVDAMRSFLDEASRRWFPNFQVAGLPVDSIWGRVLGRALAHEIGHYMLRWPRHESEGLMRAVHKMSDFADPGAEAFALTRWDLKRLNLVHQDSRHSCR